MDLTKKENSIVIRNEKLQLGDWEGEVETINMTMHTYNAILKRKEKETAKEIIEQIRDKKKGFYIHFSLMEEYEFNGILNDIAKQYGVEV